MMSKQIKIVYGSDQLVHTGNSVDQEIKRDEILYRDNLRSRGINPDELGEETWEQRRKNVKSLRENEKEFLAFLVEGALKNAKTFSDMNVLKDLRGEILGPDDHLLINKEDFKKLEKAFEGIESKSGDILKFEKLIEQLADPKEVEIGEKESVEVK